MGDQNPQNPTKKPDATGKWDTGKQPGQSAGQQSSGQQGQQGQQSQGQRTTPGKNQPDTGAEGRKRDSKNPGQGQDPALGDEDFNGEASASDTEPEQKRDDPNRPNRL